MRSEIPLLAKEEEENKEQSMKNALRCCISCILPCGALDVIRIVHCNGRVEELTGSVKASDIMKAHPKHVLKKPSTSSSTSAVASASSDGGAGAVPRIVIVPPDADLQRGKIYFLMPLPPSAAPPKPENSCRKSSSSSSSAMARSKRRKEHREKTSCNSRTGNLLVSSDRYLNEILSEKLSSQRDRRRRRFAVWRPHLESISESQPPIDL